MSKDLQNVVMRLFEADSYDETRRKPILDAVQNFLSSGTYTNIVSIAIKNQKGSDVISIGSIPLIINIIASSLSMVDLGKRLVDKDVKYFVYGVLYSFIVNEDPDFFSEFQLETFQNMYDNIFDILLLSPQIVKIAKISCSC